MFFVTFSIFKTKKRVRSPIRQEKNATAELQIHESFETN
jgi:hypothetical protein